MKDFTLEIEQAKQEVIECKRQIWAKGGNHNKPFNPKVNWYIATWESGFIVADFDELLKLPKVRRNKLLSLGGLK